MTLSIAKFLDQTAKRGSWYGGGSVAALACALSAALLEKLLTPSTNASRARRGSPVTRSIHRARAAVLPLIDQDAAAFARVIQAIYQQDPPATRRALKRAIDIPLTVHRSAARVLHVAEQAKKTIHPRYHSDLTCVTALARASQEAARAFVEANLKWLGDRAYAQRIRRTLARP